MTLQEGLRSGDRAAAAPAPLSIAADRRGRTPLLALPSPAPLTFQDYLKEADLQFLDAMRRGTSLNLADLASDPPPQTLQARSSSGLAVARFLVVLAARVWCCQ